jgi:hypothetical protein
MQMSLLPHERTRGNQIVLAVCNAMCYGVVMAKSKCKTCKKAFDKHTTWQKFCSAACRLREFRKARKEGK